jgi:hypothetical protein
VRDRNETNGSESYSIASRAAAGLVCLTVGGGLLAIAIFDPLEFRGNFLTVLSTLSGVGFVLGGIAIVTPRLASFLIELVTGSGSRYFLTPGLRGG